MKRWLLLLLAVLLVLSGCDREPIQETTQATPPQTSETTQRVPGPSLYVADSYLETNTQGAVQVFLPEMGQLLTYGFMGEDPVLFSYGGSEIYMTRISADDGEVLAEGTLSSDVDLWMGMGMGPDSLICYEGAKKQFLVFDGQLRQIRTIPVPEEISESIVFSEDLSVAYYGVENTLRALDLRTEISRLLLQMDGANVYPETLLFQDSVLYCYVSGPDDMYDGFFSVTDGRMLDREENFLSMETKEDYYVARCADGLVTEVLVGTRGGELRSFQPENVFGSVGILSRTGRLVEHLSLETGTGIQVYDPEAGNCLGKLFMNGVTWAGTIREDAQSRVWFLTTDPQMEADVLCRWDPSFADNGDALQRIGPHYTVDNPDREGLALCEARAQQLEAQYGVDICLYEGMTEPSDYAFIPEHQILLLEAGLDALEQAMEKFPEGFFRTAANVTESGKFQISLVRDIVGTQYNILPDDGGLQYWIDGNAYIALKAGYSVETSFYHELCHALETFVVGNSIHYDFWDDKNPKGFNYDYSYNNCNDHWESPWLQEENRAFIDSYSMTYPMEDRAQIFEYAITAGNESYFTSETMQLKLKQLCMAFREAFGWKKSQETFLWEQYLNESLAYVPKK